MTARAVRNWSLGLLILFGSLCAFIWLPEYWVRSLGAGSDPKFATLVDDYRKTMAQVVGGLSLLAGLLYTRRTVELAEQGKLTDRFSRAIDQLGAERSEGKKSIEIRLGGIYSLTRLFHDSRYDRAVIIDVLTAYVRANGVTETGSGDEDVRAALKNVVLLHRSFENKADVLDLGRICSQCLDLHGDKISSISLREASLNSADFSGSELSKIDFDGAKLAGVNFSRVRIDSSCTFRACNAVSSDFTGSDVQGAQFLHSDCADADFSRAILSDVRFSFANLTNTRFALADMSRTVIFESCNLDGADFTGANLSGVEFLNVTNLSKAQIEKAKTQPKRSGFIA